MSGRRHSGASGPTVANTARVWNYWLGGKDHYEIDRVVGDTIKFSTPQIVALARASRAFLVRATEHLAGPVGIRQFLDIGPGLPSADSTHEIAQRVAPGSRVLYVDKDPIVLAHARALLGGSADGSIRFVDGDLHRPDEILDEAGRTLDLSRPVCLILGAVLGHVADWEQAKAITARLMRALPPGSHLVYSDGTNVFDQVALDAGVQIWNANAEPSYHLRKPEQLGELFAELDLLEPGLVSCPLWRPRILTPDPLDQFGGVGRKA